MRATANDIQSTHRESSFNHDPEMGNATGTRSPARKRWGIAAAVLAVSLVALPAWGESFDPEDPPLGLPPVPVPEDNPVTEAKADLGEKLFKDRRFSRDGTVACATCHLPGNAFTDGQPVATGVDGQKGTRNAPTILNAAYYDDYFWDGRRDRLEGQALDPLVNPIEHGLDSHDRVLEIVRQDPDYRDRFREVFNAGPEAVSMEHVTKAIATFERTLVTGNSAFDRWWSDRGYADYPPSAERGFTLFFSQAGCTNCHTMGMGEAIFTDNRYHNLGVGFDRIRGEAEELAREYREMKDGQTAAPEAGETILTERRVSELGRFTVTLDEEDIGAFKTPTLRNVSATGPYMHDGSQETLMEVVEFYNKGGNDNPFLDRRMKPLNLSEQQKKDLVAFLKTLTSPKYRKDPEGGNSGQAGAEPPLDQSEGS